MYSKSSAFKEFNFRSLMSSNDDIEIDSTFSPYQNNSFYNEKRGMNILRSNSMRCDSNYTPNYNFTRPSLRGFKETPKRYFEERRKLNTSNDFYEVNNEGKLNFNKSGFSQYINDAPDYPDIILSPLPSRVPKKRNILSVDDEGISKKANTLTAHVNRNKNNDKFAYPPLRLLEDDEILLRLHKNSYHGKKDVDDINYSQMDDDELERHCWLTVFGSSKESQKDVLKYLIDNIGTVKSTANNNNNNYFYVRMANPVLVKKACDKSVYFYNDKEVIGFTKPISFNFLDSPEYDFENVIIENKKENSASTKKPTIRVISMDKKQLSLRDEVKPKDNGFISKIWNYVNN
uniref:Nucleoporin NUP53 n=2 Tax=Strongyloides stercoralis TaxID=6248 RepID=A0A0K0DZS2_STRER